LLDPDASVGNVPRGEPSGVAYPGYFVLDRSGIVRERFLDGRYDDRRTANGVVAALFPEWSASEGRRVGAPHVELALSQSDEDVVPGARITLAAELRLPAGVHVYAPGARGYEAIELALTPSSELTFAPVRYPPAKELRLEAAQESIPVYEGALRLQVEVVLIVGREVQERIEKSPEHRARVTVKGVLRYQACDERTCFEPSEVEVEWEIGVRAFDLERTDPFLRKSSGSR
jgi:hypothetical protein